MVKTQTTYFQKEDLSLLLILEFVWFYSYSRICMLFILIASFVNFITAYVMLFDSLKVKG